MRQSSDPTVQQTALITLDCNARDPLRGYDDPTKPLVACSQDKTEKSEAKDLDESPDEERVGKPGAGKRTGQRVHRGRTGARRGHRAARYRRRWAATSRRLGPWRSIPLLTRARRFSSPPNGCSKRGGSTS